MIKQQNKGKKPKKTPYQVHGGALFDHLSKRALVSLKDQLGLNTELHSFSDTASGTVSTSLTLLLGTPVIAQGATDQTRVGDSLRVERVRYRWSMINTNATGGTTVRVIFVARKLAATVAGSGVDIPVGGILASSTTILSSAPAPNPVGAYILLDRTYSLASTTGGQNGLYDSWDWVPQNFHMQWTQADTTGALANLLEGNFGMYIIGDAATTAFSVYRMTEFVDN